MPGEYLDKEDLRAQVQQLLAHLARRFQYESPLTPTPQAGDENSMALAPSLRDVAADFREYARRLQIRLETEKEANPTRIDQAQMDLAMATDSLVEFRLAGEIDRRPQLRSGFDKAISACKALQRYVTHAELQSFRMFWFPVDDLLMRLRTIANAIDAMVRDGHQPDALSNASLRTLKACVSLDIGEGRGLGSIGPNGLLLTMRAPIRNLGSHPARGLRLTINSEFEGYPDIPEIRGPLELRPGDRIKLEFPITLRPMEGERYASEDRRYRFRFDFEDGCGRDESSYVVQMSGAPHQDFRTTLLPERSIISPLCELPDLSASAPDGA